MRLLIAAFVFSVFVNHGITVVLASPNMAGGCNNGGAVGSSHLVNPTTGSLSTGGFEILLDGTTALQPNTPTPVTASQMYTLDLAGGTFRGALFRIEDDSTILEAGTNAQEAVVCVEASGVCHMDNDSKTEFGATIQLGGTTDVTLEVTVVVANTGTEGSIYYYDQFVLRPSDAVSPPMATPTTAPVAAPMMVQAPVPVPMMVQAPVPVPMMVQAPIPAPTVVNVPEPTNAPVAVDVPTGTPVAVAEPTGMPASEPPSVSPVVEPTQMMESDAPTNDMNMTTDMNVTDSNRTNAPISSPVRAPTAPTPTGTSSSAGMMSFIDRALFTLVVTVVIALIV